MNRSPDRRAYNNHAFMPNHGMMSSVAMSGVGGGGGSSTTHNSSVTAPNSRGQQAINFKRANFVIES